MEEFSSQKSNGHINWIVKVNPFCIRQDTERQWRRLITVSNSVGTFVRRWVVDFRATTSAMNDLLSGLAVVLAKESIKVNALSSSSPVIGRVKGLFQRAGFIMGRCALARLRWHYSLARSGKSREVAHDEPNLVQNLKEPNMKRKIFSKKFLGIFTIGMCLLTGCSFNPDVGIPSPVVSDGTVYFYTLCHFNAVDEKSGELKWKVENVKIEKEDFCHDHE